MIFLAFGFLSGKLFLFLLGWPFLYLLKESDFYMPIFFMFLYIVKSPICANHQLSNEIYSYVLLFDVFSIVMQ